MIARIAWTFLIAAFVAPLAGAQEKGEGGWKIAPGGSITKVFPGKEIAYGHVWTEFAPSYDLRVRYEGTGLLFSARGFSASLEPLLLYVSGGAYWYSRSDRPPVYTLMAAETGIGQTLAPSDFMSFPLAIGVQLAYPYAEQEKLMGFVGLHGTAHFISGDIDINQQVKFGYELVGGFAVKVFEFGVRYSAFSDMKNLGAYLGFRINPFAL
jgi:hypothetical protein